MSMSSRIKQRREALGYTQTTLAELLGVSKGSIGNYESGLSCPNEKILIRMFSVLQCDANDLYGDDLPEKKEAPLSLSPEETEIIKKYRVLDKESQHTVKAVLDLSYEKCSKS